MQRKPFLQKVNQKTDEYICRRCHRKLKDETSRKLGFGKVCYKKYIQKSTVYLFDMEGVKNESIKR